MEDGEGGHQGQQHQMPRHYNVSIEHEMENLVTFTLDMWGKLDIMFNNAGIFSKCMSSDTRNMDMGDFDDVMAVNVQGIVLGVKYASKAMVDSNIKGSIICTSGVVGIRGGGAPMGYIVSKHAILGIMRAASVELALDVALAALFLASDNSKFVGGLNLIVDGGSSSANPVFEHLVNLTLKD
ncbi:hypothetical protein L7F22_041377 [Adiantum nelumboides]|nr:hypothetical protein [Adiantum nelumboides]